MLPGILRILYFDIMPHQFFLSLVGYGIELPLLLHLFFSIKATLLVEKQARTVVGQVYSFFVGERFCTARLGQAIGMSICLVFLRNNQSTPNAYRGKSK